MTTTRRCLFIAAPGGGPWSAALCRGMRADGWEVTGTMPPGVAPDLMLLARGSASAWVFQGPAGPRPDAARLEQADLVLCASARALPGMRAAGARRVLHLPLCSELAETALPEAAAAPYCALSGDDGPGRIEGVFALFPEGLGFLTRRQQIRVAGALGLALPADPRWRPFAATNAARFQAMGPLSREGLARFYQGARAALLPITAAGCAGADIADALVAGCPVIATSRVLEETGALPDGVLGAGVWAADTPQAFRALVRAALAGDLARPGPGLREAFSPQRFAAVLGAAVAALAPG
ncbi:hypothetical protein C8P66_11070 [Humitalea rosea]|uniref:Glycosyl transferase family 1 n=1 Tax=Humitalea rosea TaxID=990373 RepID=A0A2W7IJI8_9PROT|nr:hypothetical protein [Humitalea rosea]PZW45872.1 hypothetical protein C8P66_11070 [Humitalea rosea]